MKNKRKIVVLIMILVVLVLMCKAILKINNHSYKICYDDIEFTIKEEKHNKNYEISIISDTNSYVFELYNYSKKSKKIVSNLYYYKDKKYECILPIIDGEVYVDMMCYYDDIVYNYYELVQQNLTLDNYVDSISEYNINKFSNSEIKPSIVNSIKYYNSIKNNIVLTTYKGLIINDNEVNIFKNDVYTNKLSAFVDNYYFIADYDSMYEFINFYVVNLTTGQINTVKSKNSISLDSYIQGIVDNNIYLYDKDNENQYRINLKSKKIDLISTDEYVQYYKNNKWEKINKYKANKELYFDYTNLDNYFTDYDKVIESENKFYLIKKYNNEYKVYYVFKSNIDIVKYMGIFPTDEIKYEDEYIYYKYKNKIFYYSEETGLKTLLEYGELQFNETIKYYIY